jgi:hypothetical protein
VAVTKRLRYEVLRRDNHTCRYCGTAASAAPLAVDHVVPVALGGSDEPSNLAAACYDCNTGKSASAPDDATVDDVAADALRWRQAIEYAGQRMLADRERIESQRNTFLAMWQRWMPEGDHAPMPSDWRDSIDRILLGGLPMEVLGDCVRIAMTSGKVLPENKFRYACGSALKRVASLQAEAQTAINVEDYGDVHAGPWPFPLLEILDDMVVGNMVKAVGGTDDDVKLGSKLLWEVAQCAHGAYDTAAKEGMGCTEAEDRARDAGRVAVCSVAERYGGTS